MSDTSRVDMSHPDANMFGVLPCPKCRQPYRVIEVAALHDGVETICCDDCGFTEPVTSATA